jgi:hypothetical protein
MRGIGAEAAAAEAPLSLEAMFLKIPLSKLPRQIAGASKSKCLTWLSWIFWAQHFGRFPTSLVGLTPLQTCLILPCFK